MKKKASIVSSFQNKTVIPKVLEHSKKTVWNWFVRKSTFIRQILRFAQNDGIFEKISSIPRNDLIFKIVVLLGTILIFSTTTYAQRLGKQTNFWPVSKNVMLDFNFFPPDTNHISNTYNYSFNNTSISDYDGKLLFYTDQNNIRNKNGDLMFEDSLHISSPIILPKPYNDSLYYIFSNSIYDDFILVKIVNMNKNNGLGEVVEIDTLFYQLDNLRFQFGGTVGDSNNNIWLICSSLNDSLLSISLSENGIDSIKTSSLNYGVDYSEYTEPYPLYFSNNGNFISSKTLDIQYWQGGLQYDSSYTIISKFNKKNGELYDPIFLKDTGIFNQSIISPNENYLINFANSNSLSNSKRVNTYDISNYNYNLINNSKNLIINYNSLFSNSNSTSITGNIFGQYTSKGDYALINSRYDIYRNPINNLITDSIISYIDLLSYNTLNNGFGILDSNLLKVKSNYLLKPPIFLSSYFDSTHFQPCEEFEVNSECTNEFTEFYAPPCDSFARYEWHFGDTTVVDSLNISTERNPTHEYNQTGEYIVNLTIKTILYTRYLKDTITVSDRITDTTFIGNDTSFCEGSSIKMSINNATTLTHDYLWSDSSSNKFANFYEGGIVWGEVNNSCNFQRDSVRLYMIQKVRKPFPRDTVVCQKETLDLSAKNFGSYYKWSNGDNTNITTIEENGTYSVQIVNECSSKTFYTNVYFENEDGGFNNSNVFTPNGDGYNDIFKIYDSQTNEYHLEIYNRWGKRVFYSTDSNEHWTAENQPDGIYYYSISFKNCTGEILQRKGTVSVLR